MNSEEPTVRRATVDDLDGLKQLWEWAGLQVLDLEKRLTEFQLVVGPEGDLLGAVGLQIAGKQGKLHSEAFTRPEQEDQFRAQVWGRIQIVARNHGLVRLWTQENAAFWPQAGFAEAPAEALKKLPPGFGDAQAHWLTLQLKEEILAVVSVEHEFELFQTAQKEETERLLRLGRTMRTAVMIVIGIAIVFAIIYVIKLVIRNPSLVLPGRH